MVAGSSCIDYSSLNNKRKDATADGESKRTLEAVLEYAKSHRPKVVILENVLKFPWGQTEKLWQAANYATQVALLDSKDFYLPQTRQRGYMIGVLRREGFDAEAAVKKWFNVLTELQRRASSPFTDFVFAEDDPQMEKYNRQAIVSVPNKNLPWKRCRLEVISYRSCHGLGFRRPFTDWENNGSCHVPDFCSKLWFILQVERIWDTVDINHLRSICQRCYDISYKL